MTSMDQRYHFSDFTLESYRRLLGLALRHYVFRRFDDFRDDERFVLWRHDVDLCPRSALALARIEAEVGVSATYFFSLHSDFYSLLETETMAWVKEIGALGHSFGLHFDCSFYHLRDEGQLAEGLEKESAFVEQILGESIRVFSYHNPTAMELSFREPEYGGLINAYSDFFHTRVGYCSDSNGYWRHRRLEDVLQSAADQRLQVLTHPGWWQDRTMSPRQRVQLCIDRRAERTAARYDRLLTEDGRENVGAD